MSICWKLVGEAGTQGPQQKGLATTGLPGGWYHHAELSGLGIPLWGVTLAGICGWISSRPRSPRESRCVRNWWEWEKVAAPCNVGGGGIKYFSLLTVTFLRVSSSETLSSLSFHNEIDSFSFIFTKIVISPPPRPRVLHSSSLLQRPLCCDEGSGVAVNVAVLSPRLWACRTSDQWPFHRRQWGSCLPNDFTVWSECSRRV